jgi:hypothetical protein
MRPLTVLQLIGTLPAVSFAGPSGSGGSLPRFLVVPSTRSRRFSCFAATLISQCGELALACLKGASAIVVTSIGPATVVAYSGWLGLA